MEKIDQKKTILAVDNDPKNNEVISRYLITNGYNVITTIDPTVAITLLKQNFFNLIITNLKLTPISGVDLIRHIKENYKELPVIVITENTNVPDAVQAIKIGASDYIETPFSEMKLACIVEASILKVKTLEPTCQLKTFHKILGNSVSMQCVYNTINKATSTHATVLITGDSGTGKELVARAIHYNTEDIKAPFVPVNCGAIPDTLLESELFGYVKGAFTGANENREGFFQTANNGTIFLDEISETSMSMQVKLLRVLQEKQFYMVGSRTPIDVKVRIIAATNSNIESLITKKLFREDLFYRLNVIYIHLPPLRDRGDDILILMNHFFKKYALEYKKELPVCSEKVINAFRKHSWPGNIRELENTIQRLVVMGDGKTIDIPDLSSSFRFNAKCMTNQLTTLEDNENEFIHRILNSTNDNKTQAAKILGIDRKTLRDKLNKMHSTT